MKSTCAMALIVALAGSNIATAQEAALADSPQLVRTFVAHLPIGSTVKVRLTDRQRFTAVLMAVDENGITVKPKTRIPEPARQIGFDRIAEVEPKAPGINAGKAIAIGAGIGAATVFGILMMLFAAYD